MVSTVKNTDVKQKDADHAVVLAVSSRAVFESGPDDNDDDGVYGKSVAFPLLQALQEVNKRLLEGNPAESLLFNVVLITTESQQQQQSTRIISSTRHHGLEVGRFCFSSEEDFIENLQKNNVQLFLSTDQNEVLQTTQKGILAALLDENSASSPTDQLRVLFCEDAISLPYTGPLASGPAAQIFPAQLGKIRQRFRMFDSPVCITLVTSHGGRESCGVALKALRSCGVSVDEAYCLAGAPLGPILSLLRPHILLSDCFSSLED